MSFEPLIPFNTTKSLKNLVKKYSGVFKFDNCLTVTNLGKVSIELKPNA